MTNINIKAEKVTVVSEGEKSLEMKVGLGAVPVSGRGGNKMIEKMVSAFTPCGRCAR